MYLNKHVNTNRILVEEVVLKIASLAQHCSPRGTSDGQAV